MHVPHSLTTERIAATLTITHPHIHRNNQQCTVYIMLVGGGEDNCPADVICSLISGKLCSRLIFKYPVSLNGNSSSNSNIYLYIKHYRKADRQLLSHVISKPTKIIITCSLLMDSYGMGWYSVQCSQQHKSMESRVKELKSKSFKNKIPLKNS